MKTFPRKEVYKKKKKRREMKMRGIFVEFVIPLTRSKAALHYGQDESYKILRSGIGENSNFILGDEKEINL